MALTNSDYIALASGITAVCALGVTVGQGFQNRHHNIQLARPLLDITSITANGPHDGILLKNCGPGPALIRRIYATYDNARFNLLIESEVQDLIDRWKAHRNPGAAFQTTHFANDSIISSGSEHHLISHLNADAAFTKFLEDQYDQMEISVHYECLYGKQYVATYKRGISSAV